MRTPETEVPVEHCMNLRKLIDEKREQISESEQIVGDLSTRTNAFDRFGLPGAVTNLPERLAKEQHKLDIAQRELEDLLNDFEFSECHSIL